MAGVPGLGEGVGETVAVEVWVLVSGGVGNTVFVGLGMVGAGKIEQAANRSARTMTNLGNRVMRTISQIITADYKYSCTRTVRSGQVPGASALLLRAFPGCALPPAYPPARAAAPG